MSVDRGMGAVWPAVAIAAISLVLLLAPLPSVIGGSGRVAHAATVSGGIPVWTVDGWETGQENPDLQYIAAHYDLLITDGYSYYDTKTAYLHSLNPNLTILAPVNGTIVVKNSADWNYIYANHPDWFLRDSGGNLVYEKYFPGQNYLLDPGNSGWRIHRAAQLRHYIDSHGYDGIYMDVIHPYISAGSYVYYNARPVNPRTGALYTNAEWLQANKTFLHDMKAAISTKPLIFNGIGTGYNYYIYNGRTLVEEADGALLEGFTRWANRPVYDFLPLDKWKQDVDALAEIAGLGKIQVTLSDINPDVPGTPEEIHRAHLWSLASYLVGASGRHYYNFRRMGYTTHYEPYNELWSTQLGVPTGTAYSKISGTGVYARNFTNGKALVNPTDSGNSYTVGLAGWYRTLDGQVISSITVAPKTGVLLTKWSDSRLPVSVTLAGAKSSTSYGARANFHGTLTVSVGTPPGGPDDPVTLWRRREGYIWTPAGEAVWKPATHTYETSAVVTAKTHYKFVYDGDTLYQPATSGSVVFTTRAYLTRPAAPSAVRRGSRFTVTGFLKPRHYGYTSLYFYRYSSGRWRYYKTVRAANRSYSSYTRYVGRIQLPYRGRWYIKAYHRDADHLATSSLRRYLSVR